MNKELLIDVHRDREHFRRATEQEKQDLKRERFLSNDMSYQLKLIPDTVLMNS